MLMWCYQWWQICSNCTAKRVQRHKIISYWHNYIWLLRDIYHYSIDHFWTRSQQQRIFVNKLPDTILYIYIYIYVYLRCNVSYRTIVGRRPSRDGSTWNPDLEHWFMPNPILFPLYFDFGGRRNINTIEKIKYSSIIIISGDGFKYVQRKTISGIHANLSWINTPCTNFNECTNKTFYL